MKDSMYVVQHVIDAGVWFWTSMIKCNVIHKVSSELLVMCLRNMYLCYRLQQQQQPGYGDRGQGSGSGLAPPPPMHPGTGRHYQVSHQKPSVLT